MLGGYAWLARLADKVRAEHAGTGDDYRGVLPAVMGFLRPAGVSRGDFDALVRNGESHEQLVQFLDAHVSRQQRDAANRFVLEEMASTSTSRTPKQVSPSTHCAPPWSFCQRDKPPYSGQANSLFGRRSWKCERLEYG